MTLEKPVWFKYSQKEVEELVIDLAKKGLTSEKIGLILRDNYGIPTSRLVGKKISQILKEAGLYVKADVTNIQKRLDLLRKHMSKHKHDNKSKRALMSKEAKLNKLGKYNKE